MRRGDIYYINRNNAVGHEQHAQRPAIIVSNDTGNSCSPVVEVVYLTGKRKQSLPTHVAVHSAEKPSTALCEQISTVDKNWIGRYIGSITETEMGAIDEALKTSLGL